MSTIHLLDEVYQPISSTAIREAAADGKPLTKFVEPAVADYIKKIGIVQKSIDDLVFAQESLRISAGGTAPTHVRHLQ